MHGFVLVIASLTGVHQGRRVQSSIDRPRSRLDIAESPKLVKQSLNAAASDDQSPVTQRHNLSEPLAALLEAFMPTSAFQSLGTSLSKRVATYSPSPRRASEVRAQFGSSGGGAVFYGRKRVSALSVEEWSAQQGKKKLEEKDKQYEMPEEKKKPVIMPNIAKSKLRAGDYVVHTSYGVGEFMGVFKGNQEVPGQVRKVSVLKIRYRDGTLDLAASDAKGNVKLFKRKEETETFGGAVRLDSIKSSSSWDRRKKKAAEKVYAVAVDLMRMYAERENNTRAPCPPDDERYTDFENNFTHTPTPDQMRTFQEIHEDMVLKTRPMDRLVCGDVGFGKTEVAMRAIFRTVCAGRQVGVLAPTTVLAAQHLRTMRARMPDARIELMASIVKRRPKERERLANDIAEGRVDVIIGTHALLSPKVTFHNIGLLIVDEEQRFGVKQKDKVKNISKMVDVLTLSATPIPRTMYMCMAGIREMSKLGTPPRGRMPVQTKVGARDNSVVMKAIKDELARGGQVFYVVPRIEMLHPEVIMLREFLPKDVYIQFAHGGLRDLEQRIVSFTLGNYDILVATTIMENGIDIPNVNTIVIQEAQYFGLAQLHQLRGRVGRSNVQAYAYLMHGEHISDDASHRLGVMEAHAGLNAGEMISEEDLKHRGAGNIFGEAQKGASGMESMGVEMYMTVLQRVMKYLQQKEKLGLPDDEELDALLFQQSVDETLLLGAEDSLNVK